MYDVYIAQMNGCSTSTLNRVKVRPFILLSGIIVFQKQKLKKNTVVGSENSKCKHEGTVITLGNVISPVIR